MRLIEFKSNGHLSLIIQQFNLNIQSIDSRMNTQQWQKISTNIWHQYAASVM